MPAEVRARATPTPAAPTPRHTPPGGVLAEASGGARADGRYSTAGSRGPARHVIIARAPCLRAPQACSTRPSVVGAAGDARPHFAARHHRARRHRGWRRCAGRRLARAAGRRGRGCGRCFRAQALSDSPRCAAYCSCTSAPYWRSPRPFNYDKLYIARFFIIIYIICG